MSQSVFQLPLGIGVKNNINFENFYSVGNELLVETLRQDDENTSISGENVPQENHIYCKPFAILQQVKGYIRYIYHSKNHRCYHRIFWTDLNRKK